MNRKQKRVEFCIRIASVVLAATLALPASAATTIVPRRLDGLPVRQGTHNRWPVAVMIDNHPSARPQAGLDRAAVVYEALAEGGIPRFMAVYADRNQRSIGPVRSARPYFVRIAAEYRAALAHAGGSPDALILLNSLRMPNIEGIKGKTAQFFFRSGGFGVHTLFTNGGLLQRALEFKKFHRYKPTFQAWQFVADPPVKERRLGKHGATIDLGAGAAYRIGYAYDRRKNVYFRSTGGRPHLDRLTKKQLSAKNVILQLVPKEKVLDRKGRIELKVIGKGRAVLLQNGFSRTITWEKRSTYGRTIFRDQSGQEISFVRGSTWVTIVPKGRSYRIF